MDADKLQTQLEELHAELLHADVLEPEHRASLQKLADDIEHLLKRDEVRPHHYQKLSEKLREQIAQLEASHPQLTLLMRQAIDSLAYLGI
jgi:Domain of unknown function (DUF4404)